MGQTLLNLHYVQDLSPILYYKMQYKLTRLYGHPVVYITYMLERGGEGGFIYYFTVNLFSRIPCA